MITKFDEYKYKKFKPGDWATHKLFDINPIIIKEWKGILNKYTAEYVNGNQYTFIMAKHYRKMTPKEIEKYKMNKITAKYNL